ncbi:MAG: DUF3794 domain-containing protein [Ruminococcus sp.]|nr:DUF3794 domain-containing protein [Ruminococcus sp.]
MTLKINKETIPTEETIYSGLQEQGVELDYILPDYFPDIFRLVRCEVIPTVTDYSIVGSTLSYELCCEIHLIYCGEKSSSLQCITQKQNYTKTVELGRTPESPEIVISPKTDHVNFRAVNKRRLDVRGAVSVKISVSGVKKQEIICDADGMNIQLKKVPMKYVSQKICADKTIQLSEETEISAVQPPVISIIRCDTKISAIEKKIISGKLLAKGDVSIKILYAAEKSPEPLELTLPFSQIVDMDGIDETFICNVSAKTSGCNIALIADKNGENRILRIEPEIMLICRCIKISEIMAVCDAYSTVYPCESDFSEIRTKNAPVVYAENFHHNTQLAEGDTVPAKIFSMWCSPKNINTRVGNDGKSVVISGMLTYSMAAEDSSGSIIMPDRDEAFEENISIGDNLSSGAISVEISDISVSYNISDRGILTARADVSVDITHSDSCGSNILISLSVDDSTKKLRDGDYAVKLYFGTDKEDIWDIAKRFSTEVEAVMEENDLSDTTLENGRMLLIPIKE